jgi:hypothetical protein
MRNAGSVSPTASFPRKPLPAECQIILDGGGEGALQIECRFSLEGDDVTQVDHLAMKNSSVLVAL